MLFHLKHISHRYRSRLLREAYEVEDCDLRTTGEAPLVHTLGSVTTRLNCRLAVSSSPYSCNGFEVGNQTHGRTSTIVMPIEGRISTSDMAKESSDRIELLQGTLDMLVLRTLLFGPAHGHQIAHPQAAAGIGDLVVIFDECD